MKNFQCKKCKILVQSVSWPGNNGCPGGGSHNWADLGKTGETSYQCKTCGTHVRAEGWPSNNGCPSGGSHRWNKL